MGENATIEIAHIEFNRKIESVHYNKPIEKFYIGFPGENFAYIQPAKYSKDIAYDILSVQGYSIRKFIITPDEFNEQNYKSKTGDFKTVIIQLIMCNKLDEYLITSKDFKKELEEKFAYFKSL